MEPQFPSSSFRAIFDRAAELPAAERDEFLNDACGADLKLRAAVESLLTAHDRAGSFLADPDIPADLLQAREQLAPGTRIGKFTLIQLLGEGGCGAVYLAEQDPPLRRRVALKVIKPGMDSRQVIARFELERQALAVMEHPNIAKVYDAGSTSTGHPYFVMELVEGVPITHFCRANELDIAARLRLFTMMCAAAHHAHEKGIIHRDLKPGNVLVFVQDGNPVPKVIDFGIAKALAEADTFVGIDGAQAIAPITLQPQFLGTPQYMSPEQAGGSRGDVDWRSDVYSLGALLYELLTDVPPFDRAQLEFAANGEIGRILQDVEPPPPSDRLASTGNVSPQFASQEAEARRRAPLVKGDLDRIVMKALDKDPARRYQTAAALADDVERHLECKPINAMQPSWRRRLRRALAKHSRELVAAILLVAVVIFGVVMHDRLHDVKSISAAIDRPATVDAPARLNRATTNPPSVDQAPIPASVDQTPPLSARIDAPMPASGPADRSLEAGLAADVYADSHFEALVSSRIDRQISFVWHKGTAPTTGIRPPHYSIRWRGILVVPPGGIFGIGASADDGARVRVDGREMVSFARPAKVISRVALSAGRHSLEVEYWNRVAQGHISLLWLTSADVAGKDGAVVPADCLFH